MKARINLVDCAYIKAVESQILESVGTLIDKGHVTLVRFIVMLICLLGGLLKQRKSTARNRAYDNVCMHNLYIESLPIASAAIKVWQISLGTRLTQSHVFPIPQSI